MILVKVAQDYAAGWFTANAERMQRALHPSLVKRGVWHDLQEDEGKVGNTLTAEAMVGYTRTGGGSARQAHEKAFDVEILDVFHRIATVKVSSYRYMDYLHLAKVDGRWWIINCLYDMRFEEQTFP